ncbi:SGNH/GDSL hydrolase family protein [Micrococcales bacterium 31B]|nr:SGNH/GDSL hydrolase family protein [Micrococcales bacterium 31B]
MLFQGDSITDASRLNDPQGLGYGYVRNLVESLSLALPDHELTFVNRGVSGNRVRNLEERWKQDALDLNPDIVTIMIGINDMWRAFDNNDPTSAIAFEGGYDRILYKLTEKSSTQIVLIEPFMLCVRDEMWLWRSDLDAKIQAVRRLAQKYDLPLVGLDSAMSQAASLRGMAAIAGDGVHPTPAGHKVLANAVLSVFDLES